jgi:beta-barrel assembly-enhancing protease
MKKLFPFVFVSFALVFLNSCKDGIFLFTIEDDKSLGMQVDEQIRESGEFNIMDEAEYPQAYAYANAMKNQILNGGEVKYKDEFEWKLTLIDDEVLNAFATPGGYIYFYTGLIKYLDDASSLAGVMGHEIGHADRRHSSRQMQKQFGVQTLLQIVTGGDPGLIASVGAALLQLSFSRTDETDADNMSVKYLCPTDFKADGASYFFEKIEAEGGTTTPEFLSTHPNPDNRVENIRTKAGELSCGNEVADPMINGISYAQFKALLP